jgi:hypothetical protein
MAIKLSGNEVITDAYVLQQITNTDQVTANTINNAIVTQNFTLTIYDSAGVAVKTLYCANGG